MPLTSTHVAPQPDQPGTSQHTLLDGVVGQGQYVGTFLAWEQLSNGWWGEGEINSISMAIRSSRPSTAPARKITSAEPGASVTHSRRPLGLPFLSEPGG